MNIANELLILIFNLTQLQNKVKIIELYIEGIKEIFKPIVFFYIENEVPPVGLQFEVRTKKSSFGYICIKKTKSISDENEILIKNSVQMLAVILERLDFETQIQKEETSIQQIENDRVVELQEALRESEKRFDLAMKASNDGLFNWNLETNDIYYSPAWKKMLGYNDEELPNDFSVWKKTTRKEDVEKFEDLRQKLISKQIDSFVLEFKMKHKDGHWIDILSRAEAIFNKNGKAIKIVGTNTDITGRKQAEEKIREKDIQFRKLSANVPDLIYQFMRKTDGSYCVPIASEGIINIFGCTPEDVVDSFDAIARVIHPEDAERVLRDIEYSAEHLTYFTCEFRVLIPGKPVQWIFSRSTPEKLPDGSVTWYGFNANITERKHAEMINLVQYNIANAVITSKNLNELFDSIKNELNNLIYAKNFFIALYNEKTGMLSSFVHIDEKDTITKWKAEKSLTGYVISKNAPVLLRKDDILRLHEDRMIDLIGTTSEAWLGVPLLIEGKVLGAIVVQSYDDPEAYDKSSIGILELVAHEISIYIDRQRAEENVLKLSKAIEQSPVSVIITDPKGDIEYVNTKFSSVTGYSLEEVKGKNPRILQSGEKSQEDYSKLWNAILSGVEWQGEFHNKKKNGELFWENAVISPLLNQKGKITNFIAVKEDITEKKLTLERILKSEEQFRSIWENSFDGMRLTDSNGIIIEVNEAYCKLVKQERASLLGKNLFSIYLSEDEKALSKYKDRFNSGHIETKLEQKVVLWNEEEKWISLSNSFIQTGKEKKLLLSIFRDITSQKSYEHELMHAKEKAEEMNRVKSNFLANMSHELRTPLVAILGFSEFLREELYSNSELSPMIESIRKGGNRLLETVNLILNTSQIESGKEKISLHEMNIIPLLKESFNLFIPQAANANLEYKFDVTAKEIVCRIDDRLFRDVLNNLLNNALKFTEKGCVTLKAEVYFGKAFIKVVDTGIGIPRDKQSMIWEEFRQVSEGLSRSFEGTGLGLSIVKKYTGLLNAAISLESEVGKGSTFIVELPLSENPRVESKTIIKEKKEIEEIKSTSKANKRILYVEDDKISVQYIILILKGKYYVESASSAVTALELLQQKKFDLILMDINLSRGMDGVQLTELIRNTIPEYKDIPIIAATAYAMHGDKEEFLRRGLSGYISKPFAKKDLLALIERVLN
jgi:PAS domain S-box-containing protein